MSFNRRVFHLCLIAALCTSQSSKPMQAACQLTPTAARIIGTSNLLGGIAAGCLSLPFLAAGIGVARWQEEPESFFFEPMLALSLKTILGLGCMAVGAAALGTAIFKFHLVSSLRRSQFNSHSIVQAARLGGGIALSLTALSPLNSTRCYLKHCIKNKNSEFGVLSASGFAAVTTAISASLLSYGGALIKNFLRDR
jgi:hypothetical protein